MLMHGCCRLPFTIFSELVNETFWFSPSQIIYDIIMLEARL